ncbi:MAG: hypothetical protein H6557_05290 [Lewinellaceae bacterium]|nr:hypothetical protein [Lewinellaceae bacterium]
MKKITFFLTLFLTALAATAQQATISGSILKPDGTVAPGIIVKLLDAQGQLLAAGGVDGNGQYQLSGIPTGQEYTVVPELAGQALYEVSTLDIVIGAQHILGIIPLDSPLKLLAGDVNESESLTTFDLIYIRRLVLGVENDFPRNWLFLPSDVQFVSDSDPWLGFSGSDGTILLEGDVTGFDFYAIKVGDLSW